MQLFVLTHDQRPETTDRGKSWRRPAKLVAGRRSPVVVLFLLNGWIIIGLDVLLAIMEV